MDGSESVLGTLRITRATSAEVDGLTMWGCSMYMPECLVYHPICRLIFLVCRLSNGISRVVGERPRSFRDV